MHISAHKSPRHSAAGFSLVEMSMVLIIIALIVGAVTVGRDVYRSAAAERLSHDFVQAWVLAYDQHVRNSGSVPGDDFDAPTGRVNGGINDFLCDTQLLNAMLERGISLPAGRAEQENDQYVYQDSRGLPHSLRVCFGTIMWSEPYASVGNYQSLPRNVIRLEGLTPELAVLLDNKIDGRVDARHGRFRELGEEAANVATGLAWSKQSDDSISGFGNREAQVAEMTGYLRMTE